MGIELQSFPIKAGELLQHVSRVGYWDTPLYYGSNGTNRYDDPKRGYGVIYLGRDLPTALMESVFHKHAWDKDTKRSIALQEILSRLVRAVGVMERSASHLSAKRLHRYTARPYPKERTG